MGSTTQLHADFQRIKHPLEGRLIRLRAVEPDDVHRLNPMFNDAAVLAGLLMAMPQPSVGFQEWADHARRASDEVSFVIETLEREAIGGCGLRGLNERNRTGNLGIWIGRPYWGRGYGTDAVRSLCRFGFRHMNLQRIDLAVFANNPAARRAYEKVGFRLEGTLRRAQFVGGQYVDELMMGLLVEELVED
jgi:RimJ/RimL family protein N-acetyltransferase